MKVLNRIELPSPPVIAMRLLELCSDQDASLRDIVETVSLDPSLSGTFLRMANSAYYGQTRNVSTLERAAVVLGPDRVKVVALGVHLSRVSPVLPDRILDMTRFWQGSLLRACLARQLSLATQVTCARCPGEAFLVGLLQDYVVPAVAAVLNEPYVSKLGGGGMYTTPDLLDIEEQGVELNHAHMAGRLFDVWRLPPLLTFAVTNHHTPPYCSEPTDKAMALWQFAYWVGAIPFNEDECTASVPGQLRHLANVAFGVDTDALRDVFFLAMTEYENVRAVFSTVLPDESSAQRIMEQAVELIFELDEDGIAQQSDDVDVDVP